MRRPARGDPESVLARPNSLQPVLVGVVTAFVGFASSFAVVLKGLTAVGASDAQAASGLMAAAVAMGLASIVLSLWLRQPVSSAWSTPGAALLASTGAATGGWPAAVGAFLAAAALLVAAGLFKPFGRAVAAIPAALANAMLAGVLFGLCLAPIKALVAEPAGAAAIIGVWLIVLRYRRIYATPAAALTAAMVIAYDAPGFALDAAQIAPTPVFVVPHFTLEAFASLALPLFLVTMASQNLPGVAVLKAYGYHPKPGLLIAVTGGFGALAAPFGGHAVNLSAITAAMCASPDASADPGRRWIASATTGVVYVLLGVTAGAVTRIASGSPVLVEAVAGLALLSALGSALHNALADHADREAALATFLVAASGVGFYGIGGAFWGLIAGSVVLVVTRAGASLPRQEPPK
jgi:benzoate membrane transport protein